MSEEIRSALRIFGVLVFAAAVAILAYFQPETSVSQASPGVFLDERNSQTLPLLRAARNIDPNPARGGGDIAIEAGSALVSESNPFYDESTPIVDPGQISLYVVQEGNTLSEVATMFNVSVNTIIWANDLHSSKDIHPGQTLLILPVSGVQYTVRSGDTIKGIATRYSGDAAEILAYNDITEDSLRAGMTITIPGGEVPREVTKSTKSSKSAAKGSGGASKASGGYFVNPLPGGTRTQGIHGYNGIDIAAPQGTPVRAAAGGTVIVSRSGGWNGGYGNYVVIDHPNGTQTLYAHHVSNAVSQGQKVSQGDIIGYVGSTGRSTGNHLHFEVRGARNPF